MRKLGLAGAFVALIFGLSSAADTEFQDVIPVDVAEVLFDTNLRGQLEIYSDIANDFPSFDLPSGFSVVGSVYQMNMLRVVLRTNLDRDSATQLLMAAFEQENWQEFPTYMPPSQDTGFVSPAAVVITTNSSLCHDGQGRLSIHYAERDSGNYVSLGRYNSFGNQQGSCASQLAQQEQSISQMNFSVGLRQYMPRMEVPDSDAVRQRGPYIGGGSSSSNNSVETEINLSSDLAISELFTHFTDQIIAQGWEIDSEIVGSLSANGNWTKSPEPDINLVGALSVLKTSDSNYELKFRLIADGYQGGGAILWNIN